MKTFLKEISFQSTKPTYLLNLTKKVNTIIEKLKVKAGFVVINTKHTTLGVVVTEVSEPNLLKDFIHHSLVSVAEDRRSTRAVRSYSYPTEDYQHRCQDNPYCNEIDEDYNAGAHIRMLTFSHPSITLPIRKGKMELGKYQEIAAFEFDGRDGKGKNPIRKRTIQLWIYPVEEIIE